MSLTPALGQILEALPASLTLLPPSCVCDSPLVQILLPGLPPPTPPTLRLPCPALPPFPLRNQTATLALPCPPPHLVPSGTRQQPSPPSLTSSESLSQTPTSGESGRGEGRAWGQTTDRLCATTNLMCGTPSCLKDVLDFTGISTLIHT